MRKWLPLWVLGLGLVLSTISGCSSGGDSSTVIKTIRSEDGWTVDSLAKHLPKTFGDGLKQPVARDDGTVDQVGLNMHRSDIPGSAWRDVGHGAKYWIVNLPSYAETR